MNPQAIVEIRSVLRLTQDSLAQMLGVTKATVSRYESGQAKPSGDTERKLKQLTLIINDDTQREEFVNLLTEEGGVAAAAGILGISSAVTSGATEGLVGKLRILGPASIIAGAAGFALYHILNRYFENSSSKE